MRGDVPPRWATPFLLPFVPIYAAAVAWRNRRFDRGGGGRRVDPPVVSVGNLVMGGTGKTPVCRWLAETMLESGTRPAIAMRGYRSAATGLADEAAEYRADLPGVPLAIGADRWAAIGRLEPTPDCVILDDGFQHRRLHRDLDLVLVDASRSGLDRPMIPAGPRREPLESLRRADAVIVTRAASVDSAISRLIERHHGRPPLAWTRHLWTSIDERRATGVETMGVESLRDRPVFAVFGTGHPDSIRRGLVEEHADLRGFRFLRDHARYSPETLRAVASDARRSGAEAIFTTAKDWVKWEPHVECLEGMPVLVPKLRIDFLEGEAALRSRLLQVVDRTG